MHWDDDHDEWGHMSDGAAWAWMLGGTVLLLVLIGLGIALVVLLARRPAPSGTASPAPPLPSGPDPEALRILQQRFAAGEIDEEELRARSQALRAQGGG